MIITTFTVIAILVIIYGIYRLFKGNRTEGSLEILAGLGELIFEILAAFL
jgi:hypothetical protein